MTGLLNFEILDEKQKRAFADMLDWQANFKLLRCDAHKRAPRLNLSTGKKGSSVSVNTCCRDFFLQIVEKKFLKTTV
jgi:hypothetical protein